MFTKNGEAQVLDLKTDLKILEWSFDSKVQNVTK